MNDVGGKLLSGIKIMYFDSLVCVRVKRGESERLRIDSGVRQRLFHVPLAFQCIYGCSNEGRERESGDYLASCMQMTCVMSRRRN